MKSSQKRLERGNTDQHGVEYGSVYLLECLSDPLLSLVGHTVDAYETRLVYYQILALADDAAESKNEVVKRMIRTDPNRWDARELCRFRLDVCKAHRWLLTRFYARLLSIEVIPRRGSQPYRTPLESRTHRLTQKRQREALRRARINGRAPPPLPPPDVPLA